MAMKKTILITGGTSGLGLEAARQLAAQQHELILLCRNGQKAESAIREIAAQTGNKNMRAYTADLSSHKSIRSAAEQIKRDYQKLDVLLNNAGGVFSDFAVSEDGIEMTMANNHFNYFWTTHYLFGLLKNAEEPRIVNVASDSHYNAKTVDAESFYKKKNYFVLRAYEQSKLANVLFTYALAKKAMPHKVTVNALHPGFVHTPIGGKSSNRLHGWVWNTASRLFALNVSKGASSHVYLASSADVKGKTSEYYHNCKTKRSSGISYNENLQEKLWAESEKVSGFRFL
jgi:retinol dehydrogenase-13